MKLSQKIGVAVSLGVVLWGLSGPLMAVGSDDEGSSSRPAPKSAVAAASADTADQRRAEEERVHYKSVTDILSLLGPRVDSIINETTVALTGNQGRTPSIFLQISDPNWRESKGIMEKVLELLREKKDVEERTMQTSTTELDDLEGSLDKVTGTTHRVLSSTIEKQKEQLLRFKKTVETTGKTIEDLTPFLQKLDELMNR